VTTPEIIDQIHELILVDRWISANSIAEQLGISRERVGSIIHENLDTRNLSAKWVPQCLNADQKRQRCQSSEHVLEFCQRDPNYFLSRFVTMDETWLYHYDPETKHSQVSGGVAAHPAPPQKIQVQKSAGKVLASIFWDQDGILLIDYLTKGQTINAGAIEGHFEGKTPREGHQGGIVLARQCPGSPSTCNPEETSLTGLPVS